MIIFHCNFLDFYANFVQFCCSLKTLNGFALKVLKQEQPDNNALHLLCCSCYKTSWAKPFKIFTQNIILA